MFKYTAIASMGALSGSALELQALVESELQVQSEIQALVEQENGVDLEPCVWPEITQFNTKEYLA